MRIASGSTNRYLYFVAVDSTDFTTRETGLTTFTVYRSRNGAAAAAMTTPTINEVDATNMPGVYELLLDEDTTLTAGNDTEEMVFHITQASMAPVTRSVELYRPETTEGNTLDVTATGAAGIDWGNIENKTTANDLSGTDIQLVDTCTTNTDMVAAAPTAASVADAVWDELQSAHVTAGSFGEIATEIAAILVDTADIQPNYATAASIAALNDIAATDIVTNGAITTLSGSVMSVDVVNTTTTNTDLVSAATIADAVWDESISGHATPGTTGAVLADIETDATAILADTNELQTDWADGGRLDVILDAASAPTASAVADAVWDEVLSGHLGAGSTGEALNAAGAAGDPWTTALPGAYSSGQAGYIVGTNLDAVLSARTLAAASYFDPAADTVANVTLVATTTTNTDMRGTDGANTTVPDAAGTAATLHATTDGLITTVDTVADAIKAKSDQLTFTIANQVDSNSLSSSASDETIIEAHVVSVGNVYAGDYYVSDAGSDSNDGLTRTTPFLTVTKAFVTAAAAGGDQTIVAIGAENTFHAEGINGVQPDIAGATLRFRAEGECSFKMSSSRTFTYCWRLSGTGGTIEFDGPWTINVGVYGDDSPSNAGLLFTPSGQVNTLRFKNGCYVTSNGVSVLIATGLMHLLVDRSTIADLGNYVAGVGGVNGSAVYRSSYLEDIATGYFATTNIGTLSFENCTLYNSPVQQLSTVTYDTLKLYSNLHVVTVSSLPAVQLTGTITNLIGADSSNAVWHTSLPAPRTNNPYRGYILTGYSDYTDLTRWLDPSFTTAPTIDDESWVNRRGSLSTSATVDIHNRPLTDPPPIGCCNGIGPKKVVMQTNGKLLIAGDSFVDGSAGTDAQRFVQRIRDSLTDNTFVEMPGQSDSDQLGISGCRWYSIAHMAEEFAVSEQVELAVVLGGVNDLAAGTSTATLAESIKSTMDNLIDLGVKVLYAGTQIASAAFGAEDYADAISVESTVATHCTAQGGATAGYSRVLTSTALVLVTDYSSDTVPPGLFHTDDLHPNGTVGHLWYADTIEPAITTAMATTVMA